MSSKAMVAIALAGWVVACGSANAETLRLSAAANAAAAAKATLVYAAQSEYGVAKVYDKQVFQLSRGTEVLGTLVSGSGLFTSDVRTENRTCFLALVRPDGKVALTPTVGIGEWEVETCSSIDAIGTVSPQPQTGFGRIVAIHRGFAERTATQAAVVLAWNPKMHRFEIDLEASNKADRARDRTIAAVRKVLQ